MIGTQSTVQLDVVLQCVAYNWRSASRVMNPEEVPVMLHTRIILPMRALVRSNMRAELSETYREIHCNHHHLRQVLSDSSCTRGDEESVRVQG